MKRSDENLATLPVDPGGHDYICPYGEKQYAMIRSGRRNSKTTYPTDDTISTAKLCRQESLGFIFAANHEMWKSMD
jgi:hypothetical protein